MRLEFLVTLLAAALMPSMVAAGDLPDVSLDPALYRITVFTTHLNAKRFELTTNHATTVGYVACVGDAIGPDEVKGTPVSLGVGRCPNALTKDIDWQHWPVPSGFTDPGGVTPKMLRDAVKAWMNACDNAACDALWTPRTRIPAKAPSQ